MRKIFKISFRNLRRQKRRTILTISIIVVGVISVILFASVTGAFKSIIIGQITDSSLGHIQVHRKGYVASIDTLPLDKNLKGEALNKVKKVLNNDPDIEAYSERLKFGGMISNFSETSNIRLTAIQPEKENKVVPALKSRIVKGSFPKEGEILIPELLAKGMKIKPGDNVVIVATNINGSVNGKLFKVSGIMSSIMGPGGKDGYLNYDDARKLLRIDGREVSEIAIRLKNFNNLNSVYERLSASLGKTLNPKGMPIYEVHTWEMLSPFTSIADMIDMMALFISIMLMLVVLISIMNVMVMAVYERIKEIGTIAAIGTLPRRILALFLTEGFYLGLFGTVIGNVIAIGIIILLKYLKPAFSFGRMKAITLTPYIPVNTMLLITGIALVVSIIASIEPAYKASKLEPIEALRE